MLVTVQDAMISGAMGWSDDEMDIQVHSGKSLSEAVEHLESIEPQLKKLCDERALTRTMRFGGSKNCKRS